MNARRSLGRASESGLLLAVLAFLAYAWISSPYLVGNDNAEFSTLGAIGGIAHPSTYPGYILWLRLWSWLPVDTPAHAAALATALFGAATVYVLHAAARAWGARPIAATIAVGIYAAAPLVVRYATEAEAFIPNQLAVALVLWLSAARGPLRGTWRAFVLGLVAGLGMTNHMTCTLAAPVGLLGVVRAVRESDRKALTALLAVAGLLLGWTPYLYLFVAPENLLGYPSPTDASSFLDLVLRRQYGGAFAFSGAGGTVEHGAQLRELVLSLGRGGAWGLLPVALGALGVRIARPGDGEPRAGWIALAVSFLLAGPLLALKFNVEVVELGLHVIHRFHLLPMLLLVIPASVGLGVLGTRIAARASEAAQKSKLWTPLAHVVFVGALVVALPNVSRYRTPAMENMVRNTLASMPPDAVILGGNVDELDVGIRYLQLALGQRPDVLFFRVHDAAVDWYRAKFAPYGLVLPPGTPYSPEAAVELFLARGRPVFVYWWEKELRAKFPSYPFGVLVRLLPPGTAPPPIDVVFAQNREMFLGFDLAYPLPGKHDEFATWVHRKYAGTWGRLAEDLQAAGKPREAAMAIELARALGPQAD